MIMKMILKENRSFFFTSDFFNIKNSVLGLWFGFIIKVSVIRVCEKGPVVRVQRSGSCGQGPVVRVLWSGSCGQGPVVGVLW